MDNVKRIAALYLVLTALAVFFNLILTPVYHDGSPDYPVWEIVNYFMAAGTILALATSYLRRRAAGNPDTSTADRVWANVFCYAAIALAMLFFWGWIWTLNPDSETGEAVTSHLIYFPHRRRILCNCHLDAARWLWRRG